MFVSYGGGVAAAPHPGPGRRRTQDQRSAQTRRALLDATVDCLVADGYANLTTSRIAAKAGVSRGAQVHHFPTKAGLVAEAVEHLTLRVLESMTRELAQLRGSEDSAERGLDMLWHTFRGTLFQAVLQVAVAGTADPELAGHARRLERAVREMIAQGARLLFGELADAPGFNDALVTAAHTVTGMAVVQQMAGLSDAEMEVRWRRTRAQLSKLL
jgi:AcrR family transcriptional regulator